MSDIRPLTTRQEIRDRVRALTGAGRSMGLVPTMGALHEGHLSLVRASMTACDETLVTIFLNPTQFGAATDLAAYPRTLEQDLVILQELGVKHVFAPAAEVMYPAGFSTYVEPPQVGENWEGAFRPGHFRGVATIVLKLLHLIPANVAFFGQKDYQQCLVVRQLIRDLDLPVEISVCPVIRDADGLALSSRNARLTSHDRKQALAVPTSLAVAARMFAEGERDARHIESGVRDVLQQAQIERLDYVAIADPDTLESVPRIDRSAVVLLAVHVGQTRLIDNQLLTDGAVERGA